MVQNGSAFAISPNCTWRFCTLDKSGSPPTIGLSLQIPSRERIDPESLKILHSNGSSMPQLGLAEQPFLQQNGFQHPQVILLPDQESGSLLYVYCACRGLMCILPAAVFTLRSSLPRAGTLYPSPRAFGELERMEKGHQPLKTLNSLSKRFTILTKLDGTLVLYHND